MVLELRMMTKQEEVVCEDAIVSQSKKTDLVRQSACIDLLKHLMFAS